MKVIEHNAPRERGAFWIEWTMSGGEFRGALTFPEGC